MATDLRNHSNWVFAQKGGSRLIRSIDASLAAKRRTSCSRWASASFGRTCVVMRYAPPDSSLHCCASVACPSLSGGCPPLSGLMYHVSVGAPARPDTIIRDRGWTLTYAAQTAVRGLPGDDPVAVQARFDSMMDQGGWMTLAHAVFMAAVALVVVRGVQRGIEATMKVLMPVLAVLLVSLAVYACVEGAAAEAARFLFVPSFGELTARGVLDALGLGFFSIGVGLGLMITYAAYSSADIDLRQVAVASVVADTVVSLVAGFAVFPIVFAHGLDPAGGPGLVFVSLPLAFAPMPGARVAAVGFFLLLFVAALASAVSMLEGFSAVASTRWGWSRQRAVVLGATTCFVAGIASVGSFNWWSGVHPLGFIGRYAHSTVYDLLDELTSNLLLPLGGLLLALFAGWVTRGEVVAAELALQPDGRRRLALLLRYVAPAAIVAATIASLVG